MEVERVVVMEVEEMVVVMEVVAEHSSQLRWFQANDSVRRSYDHNLLYVMRERFPLAQ